MPDPSAVSLTAYFRRLQQFLGIFMQPMLNMQYYTLLSIRYL